LSSRLRIALIPFGEVDQTLLSWLKKDLPEIFTAEIDVCPAIPLGPKHFMKNRGQYLADGLLDEFSSFVPALESLLLGITEADLFSPGLNFVFGIANRGRALISSFRLRPEFFGLEPNPKVYSSRILTEAVHELGHALGLPHCEYPGCVMYFSNWIGDTDRKGPGFCFRCARTLERLVATREGRS
jgi:archaemetzincin